MEDIENFIISQIVEESFTRTDSNDSMGDYSVEEDSPTDHLINRKRKRLTPRLPFHPSKYYSQAVTYAFNSHDKSLFKQSIHGLCTNDVKFMKRVLISSSESQYQTEEFSLDQFCDYYDILAQLIPDGVMTTDSFRSCNSPSLQNYIFLCNFRYTGCLLCKDINPFSDQSLTTKFSSSLENLLAQSCSQRKMDSFGTSGSLVTYVNKDGKIEKLELYCQH